MPNKVFVFNEANAFIKRNLILHLLFFENTFQSMSECVQSLSIFCYI